MPSQKIAHISDKFRAEGCRRVTSACNLLELSVEQNFLQFFEPAGIVVAAIDHEGGHSIVFQKVVIDYQSAITQANRGQCFLGPDSRSSAPFACAAPASASDSWAAHWLSAPL